MDYIGLAVAKILNIGVTKMQPKILVLDFGGILGTPNMRHPFKLISPRATARTNLPSCTRAEDGLTTVTTFEKEKCLLVAF